MASFAQTLSDFGLTPDYFLHFSFLNEMGSITYLIISSILFILTGGLSLWAISFIAALILSILISRFIINRRAALIPNAAIVITGCSTGIGHDMAITFAAERGLIVFATVRKQSDADALLSVFKSTPTPTPDPTTNDIQIKRGEIIPILVDVTDENGVLTAANQIDEICTQRDLILISLMNNAGYAQPAHLELVDDKRVFDQFNTNVFGLISMTNHFLPQLRRSVGQLSQISSHLVPSVLNFGSVVSFATLAPMGLYCSTKGVVKGVSDCYSHELQGMGINVVTICPGAVKTNFYSTVSKHHLEGPKTMTMTKSTTAQGDEKESIIEKKIDLSSPIEHNVQEYYHTWAEKANADMPMAEASGSSPQTVIRACYDVMLSPRPNSYQPTGHDAVILIPIVKYLWDSGLFDWAATRTAPTVQVSGSNNKKQD